MSKYHNKEEFGKYPNSSYKPFLLLKLT